MRILCWRSCDVSLGTQTLASFAEQFPNVRNENEAREDKQHDRREQQGNDRVRFRVHWIEYVIFAQQPMIGKYLSAIWDGAGMLHDNLLTLDL